jgi:uncharacterized membrane protein HdeD (DUF308 family)
MRYDTPANLDWTYYAIAGVVSILFGLAALFWPGLTLAFLVYLFAFFAILSGVTSLIQGVRAARAGRVWWPQIVIGLLGLVAGIYVLLFPGIGTIALLLVIAFWAITVGTIEAVAGLFVADFALLIVGVISILFGFILLANPIYGALALVTVIGIFAIVRGVLLLVYAARAPATPAVPQ